MLCIGGMLCCSELHKKTTFFVYAMQFSTRKLASSTVPAVEGAGHPFRSCLDASSSSFGLATTRIVVAGCRTRRFRLHQNDPLSLSCVDVPLDCHTIESMIRVAYFAGPRFPSSLFGTAVLGNAHGGALSYVTQGTIIDNCFVATAL